MKLGLLAVASVSCAILALLLDAWLPSNAQQSQASQQRSTGDIITPEEYRRAEEGTFLTFPEWFLVYSPEEYGAFIQDRPASRFPFLEHLGQFWSGYRAIYDATKPYPFNGGYHLMVMVIGTSTTVEYGIKWSYEATIGRLTERLRGDELTAEDRLNAEIAGEYAAFLNREPWYNFDYPNALRRLWTETGYWGPNPLRKWERKYAMTTEFVLKSLYARVLKQGSASAYGEIETVTTCVLDAVPPDEVLATLPDMEVLEAYPDGTVLANLPRYQPFSEYASELAAAGIGFVEIAGNRDTLLLSAIVLDNYETSGSLLMTQPILTRPGTKRIVFTIPVEEVHPTIIRLKDAGARLEHIYDF